VVLVLAVSDGDSIYSWLRGSTDSSQRNSPTNRSVQGWDKGWSRQWQRVRTTVVVVVAYLDPKGTTSKNERRNNSKGTRVCHFQAARHLSITSTSHVPGVNVAVANQPAHHRRKGVETEPRHNFKQQHCNGHTELVTMTTTTVPLVRLRFQSGGSTRKCRCYGT
jgi:hypothetical protein